MTMGNARRSSATTIRRDFSAFEPVIGLEVHAQLLTRSKMFCGCDARYADAPPNTHVCAICSGMPGSLPAINRHAVEEAIGAALALHCNVALFTKFDRKNYPYPDIPKGYQISQYDAPLGAGGWLDYRLNGVTERCGMVRVHLEEDTGKSIHTSIDGRSVSLVDYNRSGIALLEIVSEPELQSPEAAREYFSTLRQILMYLGVCDGKMQEGSLRADVNVSLREPGGPFGTKVEIKNLNSFRSVEHALRYEIERQRGVLASGGVLEQETRGWSERTEETVSQRTKEYAHDYRYFPEPDLPPLTFSIEVLDGIRAHLPELPLARAQRLEADYGLGAEVADVITLEQALADVYEDAVKSAPVASPRVVANWVTGDFLRLLNDRALAARQSPIHGSKIGELVSLVEDGTISGASAKRVLEQMIESGESPILIVERENLAQISDKAALEQLADQVLAENADLVRTYRSGKTKVFQALVGKAMAASNQRANPVSLRAIMERKLAQPL